MKDSGETLMALVNDLLDFSRMETGKLKLELKDFDVAATVEIVLALFADRLKEKGLRLSSQIQKNVPLQVRGDAVRLRQVLANLVGNATKFTDQGKVSIAITLEKEKASKAVLRFSISDTGPGLSKNQQKMLFQPFSQADPSTMRRHGGTGLGLAISKQLVELMGGTIGLKSSPGQGSTFWFTLPLQKRSRSFQPEKTPLLPRIAMPAQKARILVAEDNRINRIVAVRQLEKLGYVAETAVNGRDVLRRLKKETYDLILMDCQMPFMDGYKATAAIRKMETGRRTPIIAMTAHALEEDRGPHPSLGGGGRDHGRRESLDRRSR